MCASFGSRKVHHEDARARDVRSRTKFEAVEAALTACEGFAKV